MEPDTNDVRGDAELGLRARALLGKRHPVAAAAAVTPAGVRVASWGAGLDADYEIGSISKGVTGLLYADAMRRGEVDAATTLGDCLQVSGSAVGKITLASISVHRSGLRTIPSSQPMLRTTLEVWRHGVNPYAGTLDDLLARARPETPGRPRPRYSNLAYMLLGHALAAKAETTYQDLVSSRVADPLGLTVFYVPAAAGELRPEALTGAGRWGRSRPPWLGAALGPAGGIRATVGDMAAFVAALLDGTAPGLAALDPVADLGRGAKIGAAWITIEVKGRTITWHNGGTGGFRTWASIDRGAGTGVVLLSARFKSVDRMGFSLQNTVSDEAAHVSSGGGR